MKTEKKKKTDLCIEENISTEEFIEKMSEGLVEVKDFIYALFKVRGLEAIRVLHQFNEEDIRGQKIVARMQFYKTPENLINNTRV